LAWLKIKSEADLSAPALWGGEMAFVLLLGATGATGLALYAASGTALVGPLLAVHLGAVLAFFMTAPYSKMVHGFYRLAALARDAQQRGK
jgi:citrate/tricarballylate utilization protein